MKRALLLALAGWALVVAGCGGDSGTSPEPQLDLVPPTSPRQLIRERFSDGEVVLTWAAPADSDWTHFTVYRADAGDRFVSLENTSEMRFQDRGLDYETDYSYYVTATDQQGNESQPSNSVNGQPLNTVPPLTPVSLRAVAHNIPILARLDILLDWGANGEADLAQYRIYRGTRDDFESSAVVAAVDEPRYEDENIDVGQRYYYWITAVDKGDKESPASLAATDVALDLPLLQGPIEGNTTSATPVFQWERVPEALSYQVIVTTSPTSGEISAIPPTGNTSINFQGRLLDGGERAELEIGEVYYWKVITSTQPNGVENSVSAVESFKVQ
ncbi:MAG: hypothetical protein GKR89_14890 [Candidatus Latescibacteria bacterium]|nr:hypothetical protein [Candidatus Latescibacterota bacterium]